MSSYLLFVCILVLGNNFLGASLYSLNKASITYANNAPRNQGQGEYYVPAYLGAYNSYRQYGGNIANTAAVAGTDQQQQQQQWKQEDAEEEPSFSSKFPSIVNPSISLTGQDRLSKYKHTIQPDKLRDDEYKSLLAYIQTIRPVVEERFDQLDEFVKSKHNNPQQQEEQNIPLVRHIRPPVDTDQEALAQQYENYFGLFKQMQQQQQQRQRQEMERARVQNPKLLSFAAEGMVNPYDEIQDSTVDDTAFANGAYKRQLNLPSVVANNKKVTTGDTTVARHSLLEPKPRRKLDSPSLIQSSRNMVSPPQVYQQSIDSISKDTILSSMSDFYFVALVACISSVAIFSVIGAGYCFYKVQQSNKAAADVEFPAYGVIGPASRQDGGGNTKSTLPPADRKLAQSAQMYHYQHQKQQMISNEKTANIARPHVASDVESDEENEDGEYTVYECPGLAPTGEMEVKNPLFQDDLTPMSSPSVNSTGASNKDYANNKEKVGGENLANKDKQVVAEDGVVKGAVSKKNEE